MGERPHTRGIGRLGPTYERWMLPVVGIAVGGALAAWLFLSFGYRGPAPAAEAVPPQAASAAPGQGTPGVAQLSATPDEVPQPAVDGTPSAEPAAAQHDSAEQSPF